MPRRAREQRAKTTTDLVGNSLTNRTQLAALRAVPNRVHDSPTQPNLREL